VNTSPQTPIIVATNERLNTPNKAIRGLNLPARQPGFVSLLPNICISRNVFTTQRTVQLVFPQTQANPGDFRFRANQAERVTLICNISLSYMIGWLFSSPAVLGVVESYFMQRTKFDTSPGNHAPMRRGASPATWGVAPCLPLAFHTWQAPSPGAMRSP